MFEKFRSNNARDFRQRYEGTFGFFLTENKKRILTRLDAISEETVVFTDIKGVEYRLNVDAEKDVGFEFIPPKSNYYTVGNGSVYLVARQAARQFQRGISSKNIQILLLHVTGILTPVRMSFQLLDQLYNKKVDPNPNALRENAPMAINGQFACANHNLFLYDTCIGTITEDGNGVNVVLNEADLWRTELTDALRAIGKTNIQIHQKQ